MDLKSAINQSKSSWRKIIEKSATATPYVLFCTSVGSHSPVVTHDTFLATALLARGCRVESLLCDGALPACEACTYYNSTVETFLTQGPQATHCKSCWERGSSRFAEIDIPIHRYNDYLAESDHIFAHETVKKLTDEELRHFMLDEVSIGEEAYAGTLRFFAVGDLQTEPMGYVVMRRYLAGAILAVRTIQRVFEQCKPDVIVFHHGIYVPQGVIGQVARLAGIRVVNWAVGYRKQTFIYSHKDTYHRTMIDEPVTDWKDHLLTADEQTRILTYLDSRRTSAQDWIKFNQEPEENVRRIRERLSLGTQPIILLLTNVTWDAQLYYKNNGFPSLLDWLEYTIRYFGNRPDLQLVIRVHPAEIRGTMQTRQPVMAEMAKRIPQLPTNVHVVQPEDDLSTYALADMADCAVIYGTKTGVELTARGIPVIVAGEAWIRNKGLTIDVSTEQEYRNCLDQLPLGYRMSAEQIEMAVKYVYHYYFRRLIPVQAMVPVQPPSNLVASAMQKVANKLDTRKTPGLVQSPYVANMNHLDDLLPGRDRGLDIICNGIMTGSAFIFDAKPNYAS